MIILKMDMFKLILIIEVSQKFNILYSIIVIEKINFYMIGLFFMILMNLFIWQILLVLKNI